MKNLAITLACAALLVALTTPIAHALSFALGDLRDTTVSCGSTGDPEEIAPGTTVAGNAASSMCIINTSSTCVAIGGSTVTGSTGYPIGDGCAGGKVFCADTRRAWCEAASSSVDVNVVWGIQ